MAKKNSNKRKRNTIIVIGIVLLLVFSILLFKIPLSGQTLSIASSENEIIDCNEELLEGLVSYDACVGCKEVDLGLLGCINKGSKDVGIPPSKAFDSDDIGEFAHVCYDFNELDSELEVLATCVNNNLPITECVSGSERCLGETEVSCKCQEDTSCSEGDGRSCSKPLTSCDGGGSCRESCVDGEMVGKCFYSQKPFYEVCNNELTWENKGKVTGKCGIECTTDVDCEIGFYCGSSGKCIQEDKTLVYSLFDNKCNERQIFPSERTERDFDTFDECNENIVSIFQIVLIIVGVIVFIALFTGVTLWLIIRSRKKHGKRKK